MGRIVTPVRVTNFVDRKKTIQCDALVDTGASHLILPIAWKNRLGNLLELRTVEMVTATQKTIDAYVYCTVLIEVEGFKPIASEVIFVEMEPKEGQYEPLIGYIVLEQAQIGVYMVGHRLVPVKNLDLKYIICRVL